MRSMKPFTKKVVGIIKSIPPGKVMTYGQIARVAGSPRAARQVVRILHSMSMKLGLPWHRVINSKGQIGLSEEEYFYEQKRRLEMEGVVFGLGDLIDLERYQFLPEVESPPEW